jgi:hypothetical protein
MNKISYFSILAALLIFNSGCNKETDADKIADAQSCLDTATTSDVDMCVAKVDGLESEGAYLIRCSGKFVKEGFNNATKLSGALANISGSNTGNATNSLSMMSALSFTTESTPALNAASASDAVTYCNKAKSSGLILLSGLTYTATSLWSIGQSLSLIGTTPPTGAQLQSLMTSLTSNAQAQAAVGSVVVSMYTANCSSTTSSAPGNYCQQFQSAVSTVSGGTSNPAGIGQQIMTCYSNPSAAGCSGF